MSSTDEAQRPLIMETVVVNRKPNGRWQSKRPRLRLAPRAVLFVLVAGVICLTIAFNSTQAATTSRKRDKECRGWNPNSPPEQDPPNCLRAKQFRQLQDFFKLGLELRDDQRMAIQHLEYCILGYSNCPERPIILGIFEWVRRRDTPGETVWIRPMLDTARSMGYAFLEIDLYDLNTIAWNVSRAMPDCIHQAWFDSRHAVPSTIDRRFLREEDYHPAPIAEFRQNLTKLADHELGRFPLWRLFALTFWGARPARLGVGCQWSGHSFGFRDFRDNTSWSENPLGLEWTIAPFDYPGHTHIPLTVEHMCLSSPPVAQEERKDQVMILAKKTEYFRQFVEEHSDNPVDWNKLKEEMAPTELLTTAKVEKGDMPEAFTQLGEMSPIEYGATLARTKVMLGVGHPFISPSPYVALCRGVSVVLPYNGIPELGWNYGWDRFDARLAQHGPALGLGEPYVYGYDAYNPDDMVRQLKRAIANPIPPYIPPENSIALVRERTKALLEGDWEGKYNEIVAANGGVVPRVSPYIYKGCYGVHDREIRKNDGYCWSEVHPTLVQ